MLSRAHRRRRIPGARSVLRVLIPAALLALLLWVAGDVRSAEAAPAPVLVSATASDASAGGAGIQAGDQVVVVFDSSTDAAVISAANVDLALPLSSGHSWRDGVGNISSAVWSTTTFANDTLTIALTATSGLPTVAIGDTVATGSIIMDAAAMNAAIGAVSVGGSFGVDTLTATSTNKAGAVTVLGTTGNAFLQLSLSADLNQVQVTSVRVDRLGSAADGDTVTSGVKIYDDANDDGLLDGGDTLLGSGTFVAGSVTVAVSKSVTALTPENLLVVLDTNAGGTASNTIGVNVANSTYLGVGAGDQVSAANFPQLSTTSLLSDPPPALLSAVAQDGSAGAPGVQAGDLVTITFDRSTDAFAVTNANINTVLALSSGHSWLDGAGAIGSATWGTTTVADDTLIVVLSDATSAPSVAEADTITIGAGTIRDVTGNTDAVGSPPSISGAFGLDSLTVSATNLASPNVTVGSSDNPLALLTLSATPGSVLISTVRIARTGNAQDADTPSGGVKLWHDVDGGGSLDGSDTLLATGTFVAGSVNLTTAITVASGTPTKLIVTLDIAGGATLLRTIGVTLADATYLTVAAGDTVSSANFPLSSGQPVLAAPAPDLIGASASDASSGGTGVQAGDQAVIQFSSSTNAYAVTAANIDTVLALNNGHSWRDGSGAIGGAVWSTTTLTNDTLTVTLSTGTSVPTVAPGDSITIGASTIQDAASSNNATGSPPTISGSFGADALTVSGTSTAPASVDTNTTGVVMERVTLTALTGSVVVTGVRVDRLGTALDAATTSNGVRIYHDLDKDGVQDASDPLFDSGTFAAGTVTLSVPLVVNPGTPQELLIVLNLADTPGVTIGVGLLNSSYVLVTSGDSVSSGNFAILSAISSIAGEAPQLTAAVASDDSGLGEGVQAGDSVTLVFDRPTNGPVVNAGNIDSVLTLNNSHSWLDGAGAIGSASWSTSTWSNDTLAIVLSAGTSAPTVASGDAVTIGGGTILDPTSTNPAVGSPPDVSGTFGSDTVSVVATDLAPTTLLPSAGATPLLKLVLGLSANATNISNLQVTVAGTAEASDFDASAGISVVLDVNGDDLVDSGDFTLGSVPFATGAVDIPISLSLAVGESKAVLIVVRPDAEAVVGRTLALALSDADALTVDAADAVDAAPFPISATEVTLVGIAPTIIAAVALDTSAQGSGVQEDDQVLLVFSSGTNGHAIDAENIDAVLQLSDGHSWRSGGGAIGEAVWTSDVDENDTLTILLSTAGGKPTIAVGDAITIAAGTIQDPAGAVDAVATPRLLAGSFGSGESTEEATALLSGVAAGGVETLLESADGIYAVAVPAGAATGDLIIELFRIEAELPELPSGQAIANSPFDVQVTFAATGLRPSHLPAPLDLIVTPGGGGGATGLVAFGLRFDSDTGAERWELLPSWTDAEAGAVHVLIEGTTAVAVASVPPRMVTLREGWNLVTFVGAADTPIDFLFRSAAQAIDAVHRWNSLTRKFESAFPFAPSQSRLRLLQPLDVVWVHIRGEASVEWAAYGGALPGQTASLYPGWNLVSWVGPSTPLLEAGSGLFGVAFSIFRWDHELGLFESFYVTGPAQFNTLETIFALDGVWVLVIAHDPSSWSLPGLPDAATQAQEEAVRED